MKFANIYYFIAGLAIEAMYNDISGRWEYFFAFLIVMILFFLVEILFNFLIGKFYRKK